MIATVFRRTWAISKAETSLYVRNRSIVLTALLLTPLLVLISSPVILREENNVSIPTMVLQLVVNTSLLLVVYFNVTAIFVARREDGVFRRMDTGEATRWETVVAMARRKSPAPDAGPAVVPRPVRGVCRFHVVVLPNRRIGPVRGIARVFVLLPSLGSHHSAPVVS